MLDDRLERGRDAGRPRAEAPLAASAQGGGQARGQAEHRHGHQRPDLLGEVRQLLGRRDATRADGGRPLHALGRGGGEALRREHDRGRGDPRLDVRRVVRADRGHLRRARRSAGSHGTRHPRARRRRLGWIHRAVPRSRPGVGLPAAASRVDQRLGPQVRAGLSRRRLDRLARRGRPPARPDLLGQLSRRQHAHVRAQLLAARSAGGRAVLHVPAARVRGLLHRPVVLAGRGDAPLRRRSRRSARSSC